ncbi:DUF1016 N-terminal domain-containing protein [Rhizosphaericola mali]|uniref:DUF1016 domain-containing protein n=1 Tax=Rhizosphaericola mali TaxID=2545455 RepID=A0A5P2G3A5_9BACT|nr:DUF1016 N-terminal domain-containing protein [Rhizosphaericola mali]QES87583.1 DUF1016 domain-containing protein [Rhizosphaericola mali]
MSEGKELAKVDNGLIENIKSIVLSASKNIARKLNNELFLTNWQIGKEIIEMERKNNIDTKISRQIIIGLSKLLTQKIRNEFSRSNLFNMRKFYMQYPDVQTESGHLTWSFISELQMN